MRLSVEDAQRFVGLVVGPAHDTSDGPLGRVLTHESERLGVTDVQSIRQRLEEQLPGRELK